MYPGMTIYTNLFTPSLAAKSQKELVIKVLEENNFVIARSAKALGISRPSLYHWMKKFEIKNNPIKARPYN